MEVEKFVDWFREISSSMQRYSSPPQYASERWLAMMVEEQRSPEIFADSESEEENNRLKELLYFSDVASARTLMPALISLNEIQCEHPSRNEIGMNLPSLINNCANCHFVLQLRPGTIEGNPYRCWRRGPSFKVIRGMVIEILCKRSGETFSLDKFGNVRIGNGEPSIIKWSKFQLKRRNRLSDSVYYSRGPGKTLPSELNGTYQVSLKFPLKHHIESPKSLADYLVTQLSSFGSSILKDRYISRVLTPELVIGERLELALLLENLDAAWKTAAEKSYGGVNLQPKTNGGIDYTTDPISNSGLIILYLIIPENTPKEEVASLRRLMEAGEGKNRSWTFRYYFSKDSQEFKLNLIFDPARRIPMLRSLSKDGGPFVR